ncbi:hypothetical protein CRG98_040800 [Punica granatum]|uniref:PPM-type phosphatase domain-containing protein n=1 Tax=Punica granatum TaxID=22663 RepID=A0A2I0I5X3_PUNGR|nr:hypothetical protein CRG98_040800 [Punica granatum]
MARAFCDFCLKDFGLISVPDIFYRRLTEGDELIILATDGPGYGMFSRTREAVDIMASAPGRATASCPRSRGLCGSGLEAQDTPDEPCAAPLEEDTVEKTTMPTLEKVPQEEEEEEKPVNSRLGQSKRSLAESIANSEDDEWSALEGVARVNSLCSLPRFLSGDARSTSWRRGL